MMGAHVFACMYEQSKGRVDTHTHTHRKRERYRERGYQFKEMKLHNELP